MPQDKCWQEKAPGNRKQILPAKGDVFLGKHSVRDNILLVFGNNRILMNRGFCPIGLLATYPVWLHMVFTTESSRQASSGQFMTQPPATSGHPILRCHSRQRSPETRPAAKPATTRPPAKRVFHFKRRHCRQKNHRPRTKQPDALIDSSTLHKSHPIHEKCRILTRLINESNMCASCRTGQPSPFTSSLPAPG